MATLRDARRGWTGPGSTAGALVPSCRDRLKSWPMSPLLWLGHGSSPPRMVGKVNAPTGEMRRERVSPARRSETEPQ